MNRRIKESIHFPVHYDSYGQSIMDKECQKVADVRGWGRIQYLDNPECRQDEIGEFIAKAINSRLSEGEDE